MKIYEFHMKKYYNGINTEMKRIILKCEKKVLQTNKTHMHSLKNRLTPLISEFLWHNLITHFIWSIMIFQMKNDSNWIHLVEMHAYKTSFESYVIWNIKKWCVRNNTTRFHLKHMKVNFWDTVIFHMKLDKYMLRRNRLTLTKWFSSQ